MDTWVKCSDRFPELYKDVLVYQAYYGIDIVHRIQPIGFAIRSHWLSPLTGKVVDESAHPVTHWMPLPEPPKDKE